MKLTTAMLALAFAMTAGAAHAHDCSGGTEGGTDATGNQCNDAIPVVAVAPAPAARDDGAARKPEKRTPPQSLRKVAAAPDRIARRTAGDR